METFKAGRYVVSTGSFNNSTWIVVDDPDIGKTSVLRRGNHAHMNHKGLRVEVVEENTAIYLHGNKIK